MIKDNDRFNKKDHKWSKLGKRSMNIHKEIEQVALELFEKNGKITGKDTNNWLEAERIATKWQKAKSGR